MIDRQLQELLELARLQYDTASRLYQNAQTEYPNVVEAGLQLDDIELRLANGPAAHRAVKERSVKRLQQMESVAESRMQAARGTAVAVAAFKLRRLQAEIDLKSPDDENLDPHAIVRR